MIKKFETPTIDQMFKISSVLSKELEDLKKHNMFILFKLSKENLQKLDEELFFKSNPNADYSDFEPSTDELNVTFGDVNFKFVENVEDQG